MRRALSLARRALGSVSPNPAVGAVIVKGGDVVGEGYTQPPGHDHAEVVALRQAGTRANGGELYVTLAPCNHVGRTPPCTEAIIAAGIASVHVATLDPNPHVEGGGVPRLRAVGIDTHVGDGEREASQIIEAFRRHVTTGLPFVTAKFAMSLDGKIATRTGDSKWITGESARRYVHELRAQSDAIMAGINTVIADDPQLTARADDGTPLDRQPLRVIVDSKGRIPANSKLLGQPGDSLIAVSLASENIGGLSQKLGAEVVSAPGEGGSVDLARLMRLLGKRDVTSVFVEGGGTLLGSLFDGGLISKVVGFVAPVIIGGENAPTPVAGTGVDAMSRAFRLHDVDVRRFGDDLAVIGYCEAKSDVHRHS